MKVGLAWCLTILALSAALGGAVLAQTAGPDPQDPAAGSSVFGSKGCVRCHAIDGIGGKEGPDLARGDRPRSFYDLAASLWNHAPKMAERMGRLGIARPRLTARESADLVAFLFTANYFDRPGDIAAGRRAFSDLRCVVCHQVGGTGGVTGPSLDAVTQEWTPISLAAAMWNHGPRMLEVMRAKRIVRPTLKGSELRDLIAYVTVTTPAVRTEPLYVLPGDPESGRRLFAAKRCAECHGIGAPGKGGPDLADRRLRGSPIDTAAAMWNKAPTMIAAMKSAAVPLPVLRPGEMADILAYLTSVRYTAGAGDARKGLAVASAKGCLGCHPGLERGGGPEVESPGGALAALWNHSFLGESRAAGARAAWSPMTRDEMADLMAFLQTSHRAR